MEPEQRQQRLPRCESHNRQHIWAAFPHRNRLQEPPPQKTTLLPAADVLPGGVKRNFGVCRRLGALWSSSMRCQGYSVGEDSKQTSASLAVHAGSTFHTSLHTFVWAGGEQSYSKAGREEESLAKERHPFFSFPTKPMVLVLTAAPGCWRSQRMMGPCSPGWICPTGWGG